MAGPGLGLIAGSFVSGLRPGVAWFDFTGFGQAPVTWLGFIVGLCLFLIALMPASWTTKDWSWERRTVKEKLVARATEDPEFLKQLKADPHRAVRELGYTYRDDFEITVLEATANA